MEPAKVKIFFAFFAYSGNGGIPSISVPIKNWQTATLHKFTRDKRIAECGGEDYCDTPIPMMRNRAVKDAQEWGADFLIMVDSDMEPDLIPGAPKFAEVAFDFAYERLMQGKITVIAAPYCGPPPDGLGRGESLPYLFRWYSRDNEHEGRFSLKMLNRREAAMLTGIQYMHALPTGLILYDMRAFDLITHGPYFKYEYTDEREHTKCTTEDCYNTREIATLAEAKGMGDVLFATMDSWAGHIKVKTVGKPAILPSSSVTDSYRELLVMPVEKTQEELAEDFNLPKTKLGSRVTFEEGDPLSEVEGVEFRSRMVSGQALITAGHVTPESHLFQLANAVEFMVMRREGAIRAVEVGSWVGESAVSIAAAMHFGGELYCIDTFEGNPNETELPTIAKKIGKERLKQLFIRNCGKFYGDRIKLLEGRSVEVAESFKESQEIDFLFLDAGHTYEELLSDLCAWFRHVAQDGIIVGHDLCDVFPGVERAVQDFFPCDYQQMAGTSLWMVHKMDVIKYFQEVSLATLREKYEGSDIARAFSRDPYISALLSERLRVEEEEIKAAAAAVAYDAMFEGHESGDRDNDSGEAPAETAEGLQPEASNHAGSGPAKSKAGSGTGS